MHAYTYIYAFCVDVDARRGGCKHGCYKYIRMYMCVYTCMYMYIYIYSNMDMSILYNPCAVGARQVVSVPLLPPASVSLRRYRWKPLKSRAVHSKRIETQKRLSSAFLVSGVGELKTPWLFTNAYCNKTTTCVFSPAQRLWESTRKLIMRAISRVWQQFWC